MPTKLFVASLPTSIKKKELIDFFSQYGELRRVELVTQKNSKKGKGFSFITFMREETAEDVLNQKVVFKGRHLSIRKHLKGKELEKYKRDFTKRRMFVGSIPLESTEDELYSTFEHIGAIEKAYIIQDPLNQRSRKYGYVVFRKIESLEIALGQTFEMRGFVVKCQRFRGKNSYQDGNELEGEEIKSSKKSTKIGGLVKRSDMGKKFDLEPVTGTRNSQGSSRSCGDMDFGASVEGLKSKILLKVKSLVRKNHYRSNIQHNKPQFQLCGW